MSNAKVALNTAQYEAVNWDDRPLLVLAGAGSGKTRILTHRIAHLIKKGVPSFNILGVTFTNKAAQEMNKRIQRLTEQSVWIGTFHSTCLRILRMDGSAIGLDPKFSIYDDSDQLVLIKECIHELKMNVKHVHPKAVRERIQRAKDYLMDPKALEAHVEDIFSESVARVYSLYEAKLEKLKACDFGDLIAKTVLLFESNSRVLESWQERFKYILIDEYQDTNHAQYRLIKCLAEKYRQITVVGDPDQSIYAWRGADIQNILNFEKDYPDCGIIKMEQNYRSTANILDAANELIKHNATRKPKSLWTDSEEGERIYIYESNDEKHEAQFVVEKIREMQDRGQTLADQVIFYRTHAQSRVIEDVLRRFNVPYKIIGGVRFYDRKEIKDLIAFLKIIVYPHDDVSFKRIINIPARGIGKKAVEHLEAYAYENHLSFDAAVSEAHKVEGLTPKSRKAVLGVSQMVGSWRRSYKDKTVAALLKQIIDRTLYVETLEAERTVEAQSRIENIEEFFSAIQEFEENFNLDSDNSMLEAFLESIMLMTNLDEWDDGTNVLSLMTLHMAKGLEFPTVYMVGLEEGLFPSGNAYSQDPDELEEERRLCYVGITRAKKMLYMSYARQRRLYGQTQYNLPSRFLTEIPQNLVRTQGSLHNASASDNYSEDPSYDEDIVIDFEDLS